MAFRQLQLLLLKQQIKYLLSLTHIIIKPLHRPLLLYPLAGHEICPSSPFSYNDVLFIHDVLNFFSFNHDHMALELVLKFILM